MLRQRDQVEARVTSTSRRGAVWSGLATALCVVIGGIMLTNVLLAQPASGTSAYSMGKSVGRWAAVILGPLLVAGVAFGIGMVARSIAGKSDRVGQVATNVVLIAVLGLFVLGLVLPKGSISGKGNQGANSSRAASPEQGARAGAVTSAGGQSGFGQGNAMPSRSGPVDAQPQQTRWDTQSDMRGQARPIDQAIKPTGQASKPVETAPKPAQVEEGKPNARVMAQLAELTATGRRLRQETIELAQGLLNIELPLRKSTLTEQVAMIEKQQAAANTMVQDQGPVADASSLLEGVELSNRQATHREIVQWMIRSDVQERTALARACVSLCESLLDQRKLIGENLLKLKADGNGGFTAKEPVIRQRLESANDQVQMRRSQLQTALARLEAKAKDGEREGK